MEDILIGTTDRTVLVFIPDPASTTGAGKTGLNAAALTCTYTRVETDNDVVHTDVTSSLNDLSALTDAHNDWGLKEVSSTLSKGLYRLDIADAVFASGAWYGIVQVTITSGTAAATPKAFRLVSRNDLDGVRLGLTALPNAAADAAGGLIISDAGGLDADAQLVTKINDILTDTGTTLDGKINTIDGIVDDILLDTAEIGEAGAGLTAINLPNQTMDIVGNITGNLSGSVGSVTGAVGSVTGAVGSVTGAVGSVTAGVTLAANAVSAAALAADAGTEIGAAVLAAAAANPIDSNVKEVNDVALTGTGTTGDEWGPA